MSNWLIGVLLVVILFPGFKGESYRVYQRELPWWILVVLGFTISVVGLLKFNDDRIVFAGCALLALSKLYSYIDAKNWEPEEE